MLQELRRAGSEAGQRARAAEDRWVREDRPPQWGRSMYRKSAIVNGAAGGVRRNMISSSLELHQVLGAMISPTLKNRVLFLRSSPSALFLWTGLGSRRAFINNFCACFHA
jgi:hypothetical protein